MVGALSNEEFIILTSIDLIRSISDPEHPNTLEELRVVSAPQILVKDNHVTVEFTPTVPHCGMSTLIGRYIFVFICNKVERTIQACRFVFGSSEAFPTVSRSTSSLSPVHTKANWPVSFSSPRPYKTRYEQLSTSAQSISS
jgi:hypothetical protein